MDGYVSRNRVGTVSSGMSHSDVGGRRNARGLQGAFPRLPSVEEKWVLVLSRIPIFNLKKPKA